MNKKIIICKGLPASGKSTWAKEYQVKNPNTIRVNKDELRAMLHNGVHSKGREKFVIDMRDYVIITAVMDGNDVIVDDTNLNPIHEKNIRDLFAKDKELKLEPPIDVEFIIQDFTDVPVDVCIERDRKREKSVGKRVIMDMYKQYLYTPPKPPVTDPSLPRAIICDLDGTLCLLDGRSPYDTSKCLTDKINLIVADIIGLYTQQHDATSYTRLIFCSGREDKFRDLTEQWLKNNGVSYDKLFMRPTDDFRKDSVIKQEIYDNQIKGKYNIDFVLDDRNQVVDMWRSNGLTCLQVAPGDF